MDDWTGSVINPPAFEDEGALHIGRGKFLLFMSGDKTDKASRRLKIVLAIVAVTVIIATLILTTLLIGHQPNDIPYKWKLKELLGSDLETISKELEIPVSDWIQQADGTFTLNEPLKVSGISYELTLHFDKNATMHGYEYIASYKADKNKAAMDIYKASVDLHINAYGINGSEEVELTSGSLKKYFSDNKVLDVNASNGYSRQNSVTDPVEKYLKELESDPTWPGLLHGYVVRPAIIYNDIHVEYTPENESVLIHIAFQIEPERTN